MNNYSLIVYKEEKTDRWGDTIQYGGHAVYLNIDKDMLIAKCIEYLDDNYEILILKDGKRLSLSDNMPYVYDDLDEEIPEEWEKEYVEITAIVQTKIQEIKTYRIQQEKERKEKEEQARKDKIIKQERALFEQLKKKYE